MIERFGRAKVWPWLALVVVLGVVGAFAADAIVDGKRLLDFPGRGAPIAAFDQVQEVSNADPPARSSREAEKGTSFAKQLSAAFHNAAEKVLPCVVTIVNTPPAPSEKNEAAEDDDNGGFNPWEGTPFGDLFRFRGKPLPPHGMGISTGCGVIIDPSGIILTNTHVVEGDGTVTVRLADGREFRAKDVKMDPQSDLAVLRIEKADNLKAARFGDSNAMDVGDWVLALGQPFGLEGTVTAGIISSKGRVLDSPLRQDLLQTDAAINPGNSGGPLVNLDGEVIGINRAIATQTGGYQGVGFAIPANLAKWVCRQLVGSGKVRRAYLGVSIQLINQQLAEQFGVAVHEGVLIGGVRDGGPAAKAGVKEGDIILEFAGKKVSSPQELQGYVEETPIDVPQRLKVVRNGKTLTLDIVPNEQPADYAALALSQQMGPRGKPQTTRLDKLGIQAQTLTPEIAKRLEIDADRGAVITDVRVGSPAALAGLESGMVILQAQGKPVANVEDLRKILAGKGAEKDVLLHIQTSHGKRFVSIQIRD